MMSAKHAIASAATLLLLILFCPGSSSAVSNCAAPAEMTRFKVKLLNTFQAIHSHKHLVIVAVGSSSTEGIGASDGEHTYPARLAEELRHRWPGLAIDVLNKGVRGEVASEMLARFDRDVLPFHPQLVIWQTGSNHTLRSDSIDGYADTVRRGIRRLKEARADVVLMDPQFAPRVLARAMHISVVDSLAALASDNHVALFRRFAVMQHWISSGQYKLEDIVSRDGLHMNDLSYGCIARLLAGSLAAAAADRETPAAARHVTVKVPVR